MIFLLALLLYGLPTHVTSVTTSTCATNCMDPDNCPPDPTLTWMSCKNRPAAGQKWACQDPSITFPTVECLLADIKTCGNLGENTVFYSFGASTTDARSKFRGTLNPIGVMFDDALDEQYWTEVIWDPRFNLADATQVNNIDRWHVVAYRLSQAMAKGSTGDAYVVVPQRNGPAGGVGAYQLPPPNIRPNVWRTFEFPVLQQNSNIKRVLSVDVSNNYQATVDWESGNSGQQVLPVTDADSVAVPPLAAPCNAKFRRDTQACATTTACVMGTVAPRISQSTPTPTLSCVMQNEDP